MIFRQALALLTLVACCTVALCASQQQSADPKPQLTPTAPARDNTNQEINDRYVQQVLQKIAGRENEPAGKVFKNVQIAWFKSVPAGRFLRIMNGGYSRALGVSCTHCHLEQDFASDDKRPKRAAREMAAMHRMINEQLGRMQNLETKPQERAINCSTCHRGAVNPMASER
ncbi:MAG: c-type cytochrome [Acidobacteria bacterium]|nr:c-type cytochrome [Acidobacteriota bacterium]